MRPLTEEETRIFFEKLAKFIGRNIKQLVDRPDENHVFRLHKDRVYYVSETVMKTAQLLTRDKLACLGTCFGKFTKGKNFRLHITCLEFLSDLVKFKVWVKPSSQMSFMYGNHVLKAGLGRITENTPKYQGVVVYTMANIPIGFGVTAHSTAECRKLDPTSIVTFHQADVGEYLRDEDNLI
uniref:60S ribosome subunit biogenesis protein NIP7 homolog n=1 Tax=Hirondellea gigas TaxID=1518452 RepID=A0A6A7G7S9_9CRUS